MKRNTYVTAALFVVFGLLTAIYMNMDRFTNDYPDPALTGAIGNIHPNDVATIGEVDSGDVDEECCEDSDAMADAEAKEDADNTDNDADTNAVADAKDENNEDADDACCEVISLLDSLRMTTENEQTEQVNTLLEIMASADFSAAVKSAAKDSLNDLNALAHSSRMLETMVGHRGFDDVLVRASADFVHVTIQVSSLEDVPTREELAELYILAGIQFGGHRNGNISIDFQPLN